MNHLVASAGTGLSSFFIEAGAVILALAILARVAARVTFPAVPLYLVAGLIMGALAPPDWASEAITIESQVAVILLLFMLGLEYTAREITDSLRATTVGGIADLLLNFTPGLLAGLLLGWGLVPALLLGGVTYISSSGIVAKLLDDLGRLGNRETPRVLSVLVIEDLAMAVYLPVMAILLAGTTVTAGLLLLAVALALVIGAFFVATRHSEALSRSLHHPSEEVVLLTVLGLLLMVGGIGELLQVSGAVLAFLAGLALSGEVARSARRIIRPLRDLFAALFFLLFGLQIDVGALPQVALVAAALCVATIVTKFLTGWIAARRDAGPAGRIRAGMALVARGEFSIFIAGIGVSAGVESSLGPLAAAYVLLTAVFGPLLTRYADRLARPFVRRKTPAAARGVQDGREG